VKTLDYSTFWDGSGQWSAPCRRLKIFVSAVRFCPCPPEKFNKLGYFSDPKYARNVLGAGLGANGLNMLESRELLKALQRLLFVRVKVFATKRLLGDFELITSTVRA
jgi:hypothetical protein